MTYFHEVQPLRKQRLIVVVLIVVAVVVLASLLLSGEAPPWVTAIAVGSLGLVGAVFFAATLDTTVGSNAVTVAFRFLWPTRRIGLSEVRRAAATRYRPLLDYGGYGVRLGTHGIAFNVSGDEGVVIEMKDGSRVMIGSQRARELESAIARAIRDREDIQR